MKSRFLLFRRGRTYYVEDAVSGKQLSLRTKDRPTAERLLHAKNEAERQPAINLQIARAYLAVGDPNVATRSWQFVMDEMAKLKRGRTLERWARATADTAFDLIRHLPILETRPEHFLRVLEAGTVSTNVFLRRIHNFALDMTWLPWPVIVKRRWPSITFRAKRALRSEEHSRIVAREPNPETRAFYEMCWHLGGSQSDMANLRAEDIDWTNKVVTYHRAKTDAVCLVRFGPKVEELLRRLPSSGFLFPRLAPMDEKHRAKEFSRRCQGLGIQGVTLHSYRYSWAERAKAAGYPERFAQEALGHNSSAVHRAYAKRVQVVLPPLEQFESQSLDSTGILPFRSFGQ